MDLPVSSPPNSDLGRHALADGHIEEDARCALVLRDGVPQSVHHGLDGPADGEEGRFGGEDEEFAEGAHVGAVLLLCYRNRFFSRQANTRYTTTTRDEGFKKYVTRT